jgi:hypothetical protein
MVSENSGRSRIGLGAIPILALASCADMQAKNRQAIAQDKGGPGGHPGQGPVPGEGNGGQEAPDRVVPMGNRRRGSPE